jgi:hypothetical protein
LGKIFIPWRTRNTIAFGLAISCIVAVCMGYALWILREAPLPVAGMFAALLCAILGLMLYLTASATRMSYELGESGLSVHLGLGGIHVPYSSIAEVQKSRLAFTVRIFGGSWPGFHFGLFRVSDVGNVTVYTTRMRGEFALLTLTNGRRMALSPEDTDGFLQELDAYSGFFGRAWVAMGASAGAGALAEPEQMPKKIVYLQVAIVATAFLGTLVYLLSVYPSLPQTIPVHFDANMNPNRWGDKSELFFIAGLAALFAGLNTLLCLKFWRYGRLLTTVLTFIFLLVVLLCLATIIMTVGMV